MKENLSSAQKRLFNPFISVSFTLQGRTLMAASSRIRFVSHASFNFQINVHGYRIYWFEDIRIYLSLDLFDEFACKA